MATLPWPHRVTFLAPVLWVPRGEEPNLVVAGHLLATILGEHFVRHPIIAVADVDDITLSDAEDRLVDANHPRFADEVARELVEGRRDEVLWFELALYPPARAVLTSRRRDGAVEQWVGADDGTVSGLLMSCLDQWLTARWLPRAPLAIEPFTLPDFFAVVHQIRRVLELAAAQSVEAAALIEAQSALRVPFLRLVDAGSSFTLDSHILSREADNPRALLSRWQARAEQRSLDELRRICALAPQWGRAHLAFGGPDVAPEEALAHHAIAARLMPRSAAALDAYAMSLRKAGRFEDAYRIARRATRAVPTFVQGHLHVLHALQGCHRHGEAFLQAQSRRRVLEDAWRAARAPVDRPRRDLLTTVAHMTFDVGRVDDAVAIYKDAIQGLGPTESVAHRNVLRRWETDAVTRASAWARDAHYRSDPSGVIYGYGKGRVEDGADTARLVDALVDAGEEEAAAIAASALRGARLASEAPARLATAKALIVAGELPKAYNEIERAQLRFPQYKLEAEVNRLLRLAATRPLYEWDNALRARMILGAPRLGRLAARDAADFVPGIERSAVWRAIAGEPPARVVFDQAWLEPLRQALGHSVVVEIDLFFQHWSQPTLENADRLAAEWTQLVAARRAQDPTADAQTLYVLANALCRYLALTTQPPTPLAGGYRQVATDAMLSCARAGVDWLRQSIHPFLGALEQAAGVDPWIFDAWLLKVERFLDLDHTRDGTVRELAAGLRRVPEDLRGDERVAFELQLARDLAGQPDARDQVLALLQRCVRATGAADVAEAWSRMARPDEPDGIDAHAIAAVCGAPPFTLVSTLAAAGKKDAAFDVLCRWLPSLPPKQVPGAVAEAARAWPALGLDFPPDPRQAFARGEGLLRAGQDQAALGPLRWAAVAGGEAPVWRALAIAYARAGLPHECAWACGAATRGGGGLVEAARLSGKLLGEAGKWEAAVPALRLARLLTRSEEDDLAVKQALQLGGIDEVAADPARRAWQALVDGDAQTARALAATGQSWPLTRAAVTAASIRGDADAMVPVAAAVRGQLEFLLSSTNGHTDGDAVLTRLHILRLREDASFAIDPPPPLGARVPRERIA